MRRYTILITDADDNNRMILYYKFNLSSTSMNRIAVGLARPGATGANRDSQIARASKVAFRLSDFVVALLI